MSVLVYLFRRYKEDMAQLQTLVEVATGRGPELTSWLLQKVEKQKTSEKNRKESKVNDE